MLSQRNLKLFLYMLIYLATFSPKVTHQSLLGSIWNYIDPGSTCSAPLNFPTSIPLSQQSFDNWADAIYVKDLWTATPNTPEDVVIIANWAASRGFKVRASGFMHTWVPITVTPNTTCEQSSIILIKTAPHLNAIEMATKDPLPAVKVQTGASMESLLSFLEENGYGFLATPAPGDLTIGGVLAIDGHGTGVPAVGEAHVPGFTYGSLSNLIVAFTAVVWDSTTNSFILRTFDRSDPDAKAFLTSLGRAFLTDVTLRVGPNYNLRCQSIVDIPASELFAPETSEGLRTYSSFLDSAGRVETIWFPFTDNPWLKVWTVSPEKPSSSWKVSEPFNYAFSDNIPEAVALMGAQIMNGAWFLSPEFGDVQYGATYSGIILTLSSDLWGPSKDLLLYIKPSTLRETANGYAVITIRSNVQKIIHEVADLYQTMLASYRAQGKYPINGPLEIRVTGLDVASDVGVPGAESPALSAIRPVEGHPEFDTAVWFDVLSFPKSPLLSQFMAEFESFLLTKIHNGVTAFVRPEWSKGWGYTDQSAWANSTFIKTHLPTLFSSSSSTDGWAWTVATLNKYDPNRIFSNEFLDELLV